MSIIKIAREVSCQVGETSVIHLLGCEKQVLYTTMIGEKIIEKMISRGYKAK